MSNKPEREKPSRTPTPDSSFTPTVPSGSRPSSAMDYVEIKNTSSEDQEIGENIEKRKLSGLLLTIMFAYFLHNYDIS